MNHPIFKIRAFLAYLLVWLLLAVVQCAISVEFLEVSLDKALLDAVLSHLWGAALGISVWYALAYHVFKHHWLPALVHHFVQGSAFAALWAGGIYTVLSTIYAEDADSLKILQMANPWRVAAGAIYYGMLVLVYSLLHSLNALRERIENEVNLKGLLHQSELNLLKSQLNPHFLFNSLNSVSALVEIDPGKAQRMIASLAEYLRYSIAGPAHASTSLEEELGNARRYLSIEQIRFGDKLSYSDHVPAPCLAIKVPSMLLQPLYENAVKHGAAECVGPARIDTSAELLQGYLHLQIRNTLERPSTRKGTGLGLRNVRERLRLFYGDGKARMQTSLEDHCYTVSIVVPNDIPHPNNLTA